MRVLHPTKEMLTGYETWGYQYGWETRGQNLQMKKVQSLEIENVRMSKQNVKIMLICFIYIKWIILYELLVQLFGQIDLASSQWALPFKAFCKWFWPKSYLYECWKVQHKRLVWLSIFPKLNISLKSSVSFWITWRNSEEWKTILKGLSEHDCCNCNWVPRHEGVLGEWMYSSTHSLTSALDGGEWLASRPGRFTPREKALDTHWIGGWAGPGEHNCWQRFQFWKIYLNACIKSEGKYLL
jgi:hypothetical protein